MPNDRIILKGMQFYGFHGVNPEERVMGQSYLVDLVAEIDLSLAGQTDFLGDTASYTHLYRAVKEVLEGKPFNLLERLAQAVADRILEEDRVASVEVTVKKPHPPIKGSVVDYAAVEIRRSRP